MTALVFAPSAAVHVGAFVQVGGDTMFLCRTCGPNGRLLDLLGWATPCCGATEPAA